MVEAAQAAACKNGARKGGRPRTPVPLIIEALFHRLRSTGAWTDLPSEYGPWRTIYGWFQLWTASGLWQKLLATVAKARGVVRLVDGTHIPVHQCACNPRGGADQQAMGRTRGGRNSKVMALTDTKSRLVSMSLVPGQAYEGHHVMGLLPEGSSSLIIVGDKAYDDDKLRRKIKEAGHRSCFPCKSNRKESRPFNRQYYKLRFAVEDYFRRLKRWAGTATRRDKLAVHYTAWVYFAAIIDWMM